MQHAGHTAEAIAIYRQRASDGAPVHLERHRSEQTTLYRLVHQHAATFIAETEAAANLNIHLHYPVLVEEEGSTYLADNDDDSDEARTLRPLQAASGVTRRRSR